MATTIEKPPFPKFPRVTPELPLTPDVPLRWLDDVQQYRFRNARFPLEIFWDVVRTGMTAEQIVDEYDTLELEDVRAVVAFCGRHPAELEAYLKRVEYESDVIEQHVRAHYPQPTRAELLARPAAREAGLS